MNSNVYSYFSLNNNVLNIVLFVICNDYFRNILNKILYNI